MRNKKRVKRKKPKARKQLTPPPLHYSSESSPFGGLPKVEALELMKRVGQEFGEQYPQLLEKLKEQVLQLEPLSLLSFLSFHYLTTLVGSNLDWQNEKPLLQHHVELTQALILQHKLDEFGFSPIPGPQFARFVHLAQETAEAFAIRRYSVLEATTSKEGYKRVGVLEQMRAETQVIRNWGYPQQVVRIVTDLFSGLEDCIEQRIGVRIGRLINMLLNLGNTIEERTTKHLGCIFPMLRAKSIASAVDEYHRQNSELRSSGVEECIQLAKERGWSLLELKSWLFAHSTLRLSNLYTFTLDELVEHYPGGVNDDVLRRVLDNWTLSFGDLKDKDPEHFFMANPIWQRPIICLDDDTYFWPIIGLALSFCIELFESVIVRDKDTYERYEKRRARFLEDEAERLFRNAFPFARFYRGSIWQDPTSGRDYENDLLVLVDSYLIVVEAKSGKVTPPARRGAEGRLQQTIEKLLVESSEQGQRFAEFLRNNPGNHRFSTMQGTINEVDTSGVYYVIRLNVTLESLGALSTRWPELRAAGFISSSVEMCPTMSIAELENVFELLEGTSEKLHYLVRRSQFEINADYLADEMDLLAFYVDTAFNIGEDEFNRTGLFLYGVSKSLDPYFSLDSRDRE